jgi:microcystin-dependent protein
MANTTNKNLNLPANSSANWDVPLNANFSSLDAILGATQNINITGFLTTYIGLNNSPISGTSPANASYLCARIGLVGTLSADVVLVLPSGVAGIWDIANYTTGSFAVKFVGANAGNVITIPQNREVLAYCDGTSAIAIGGVSSQYAAFSVGDIKQSASPNSSPGWFLCDGSAVSRTSYAALFTAIGTIYGNGDGSTTFNLPDCRGCVIAAPDDQGGRGAAGLLPGYSFAVKGGASTAALTDPSQNAAHTHGDTGHSHGVSQSPHAHSVGSIDYTTPSSGVAAGIGWAAASATSANNANVSINVGNANLGYSGSGAPHNNVQPTIAFYTYIYTGV